MIYSLRYCLFLILIVGFLSAGFHSLGFIKAIPWYLVYSDTLGFFDRAVAPGFPYISKAIEYPVFIGLFIQLAGFLGKVLSVFLGKVQIGYFLASVFGLVAAGAAATYFLYQTLPGAQRFKLFRYWIFAPSLMLFLTSNWDIFALMFTAAALYLFSKEKFYWGTFLLSLGFSAKFYPILYFSILFLKKRNWQDWLKILGILIGTTAVLNGFFILNHFDTWSYFYTLNITRESNPDSIWTVIRYFVWLGQAATVNWLSLVLFSSTYFYFIWTNRKESLVKLFAIATVLFLLFNKIFSPQYILWLLPFWVLLPNLWQNKKLFYALEFSNLAAFFIILPWFFLGRDPFYFYLASPFVILRHLALAFVLLKIIKNR